MSRSRYDLVLRPAWQEVRGFEVDEVEDQRRVLVLLEGGRRVHLDDTFSQDPDELATQLGAIRARYLPEG